MLRKKGRPLKYAELLKHLVEDELYSPHSISEFALTFGYIKEDDKLKEIKMRRIRISCNHIHKQYEFPVEGDGYVTPKGQHRKPAWYGRRWREVVEIKRMFALKKKKKKTSRKRRRKTTEKGTGK